MMTIGNVLGKCTRNSRLFSCFLHPVDVGIFTVFVLFPSFLPFVLSSFFFLLFFFFKQVPH